MSSNYKNYASIQTVLSIKLKFDKYTVDHRFSYYINFDVSRRYSFFTGYKKCRTLRPTGSKYLRIFEYCEITWIWTKLMYGMHFSSCIVIIWNCVPSVYSSFANNIKLFIHITVFCLFMYWNARWLQLFQMSDSNQMFWNRVNTVQIF